MNLSLNLHRLWGNQFWQLELQIQIQIQAQVEEQVQALRKLNSRCKSCRRLNTLQMQIPTQVLEQKASHLTGEGEIEPVDDIANFIHRYHYKEGGQ